MAYPEIILTPRRREAIKLLGITPEEWWFTTGRYLEARRDLTILRTSLKRIAEMTGDPEVLAAIPEGEETHGIEYAERGWNRLAAFVVDWIERKKKDSSE